jgi:hypothetical protein
MHKKMRIGVIGANQCTQEVWKIAFEVGRQIARHKAILICGGLGGVMEAAAKGAKSENGLTIGILPGGNPDDANEYIDIPIVTGINYARNVLVARTSQALIAVGGRYGTLSEIAHALNLGHPVIGINTWDLNKIDAEKKMVIETDPAAAVAKAVSLLGQTAQAHSHQNPHAPAHHHQHPRPPAHQAQQHHHRPHAHPPAPNHKPPAQPSSHAPVHPPVSHQKPPVQPEGK